MSGLLMASELFNWWLHLFACILKKQNDYHFLIYILFNMDAFNWSKVKTYNKMYNKKDFSFK